MPLDAAPHRPEDEAGPSWRAIFGDPRPEPGDTLVHLDYGVGRFEGVETVEVEGASMRTARLVFDNEASLMVPEADFGKLWAYGAGADAPLDALDGETWADRLAEARVEIGETAQELVARVAARRDMDAAVIEEEPDGFDAVVEGFAHDLTDDQERADGFVARDLAAGFPMERLVIGDVGYGKTEVVIRAAARVALSGHQVAVLLPTTVLCRQVADELRARLGAAGISVGELSSLVPQGERKETRKGLRGGEVQVVVGTSALAVRPVRFNALGLVIVDEEHKFGAKAKEALRKYETGAHRLFLTATPIPKALTAAEVGLMDVSVLATPPKGRKPVRTSVDTFSDDALIEPVERELESGGRAFVVVPRIADMEAVATVLGERLPEARVVSIHGKMKAGEVDAGLIAFRAGEADVLLSTNIVENGIDIASANTMVVCMGGRLGLAQLHQLRGRVGRGAIQGHMYVLARPSAANNEGTMARLRAFGETTGLGAGFRIALLDRNRRGGGDLLGEAQTGHLTMVGTGLYRHILMEGLREASGE